MNAKRTILQVPMEAELKTSSESAAREQGFSSLQEAIRVFLNRLARREVRLQFVDEESLSPRAVRRYERMVRDIQSGKVKTRRFTSTKDLMEYLRA